MKNENLPLSQVPLKSLVETSDLVKSTSMNLIDDTAEHLFDLMVSLEKESAKSGLPVSVQTIRETCNCAAQIHKLLNLKLDVLKQMARERNDY